MENRVTETLAVNTGNMIASLNMQLAKQQVAHEDLEKQNQDLRVENDKLKIENAQLRKKVKANEPHTTDSTDKQINKHS